LGPMLREYIISESMAALGIPTTRSLAVVTTGEPVYRYTHLQGAILTRVAASHIRVGTFEYAAAIRDESVLRALADYTIKRHFPELSDSSQKYLEFFLAVTDRQAALIAQWQLVGFIHGVMNTDNMAISGETIDYGPCAFMDAYNPATVFSSIDRTGRYAYGNQPMIAQWNLARLAETLLPILDADVETAIAIATKALESFKERFDNYWLSGMRKKLGLTKEEVGDRSLIQDLLDWMQSSQADFTNTFRDLSSGKLETDYYREPPFMAWHARWQSRLRLEDLHDTNFIGDLLLNVNPAVIPRNHLVEEALSVAVEKSDLSMLHSLLAVLAKPYSKAAQDRYQMPSTSDEDYQTFCGT